MQWSFCLQTINPENKKTSEGRLLIAKTKKTLKFKQIMTKIYRISRLMPGSHCSKLFI